MVVIVQSGQDVTLPLFADRVYMPGAQYTAQNTWNLHKFHILNLVRMQLILIHHVTLSV